MVRKLALNVAEVEGLQSLRKWDEKELSKQTGISRTMLWRAKLPPEDPRHSLGKTVIDRILKTFPEKRFEQLFYFVEVFQKSNTA